MISIRKRENETIIIQNFKREYLPIFSYLIGGYSILNFLSMIKVDINFSYKFEPVKPVNFSFGALKSSAI